MIVSEVDPDAPTRQNKRLSELDEVWLPSLWISVMTYESQWCMSHYDDWWVIMMIEESVWWLMNQCDEHESVWWPMSHDDVQVIMMTNESLWWPVCHYDVWVIMMTDESWWCMGHYDDQWVIMMIDESVWWPMSQWVSDVWVIMMGHYDDQWVMMMFESLWWPMSQCDDMTYESWCMSHDLCVMQ